ncbi:DUF2127 domain-containing protein [Patescibacteria group bacterium]|nr:DUF2127 domain-containing protein [Patescibacteria group bacterium]
MIKKKARLYKVLHGLFDITIISKSLEGLAELFAGLILWFNPTGSIVGLVGWLFWRELAEDPSDFIANYLTNLSSHISFKVQFFLAVYFLLQGSAKIVLSAAVYRGWLWSYRWYELFLAIILTYQAYHWLIRPTWWLAGFIIFDCLAIWLIEMEYRKRLLNKISSL